MHISSYIMMLNYTFFPYGEIIKKLLTSCRKLFLPQGVLYRNFVLLKPALPAAKSSDTDE